jgi:methylmalonyl-CoA mutase
VELRRSDDAEKRQQLERLRDFQRRHAAERPVALAELQRVALEGGNTFDALMRAVRHCSLGEITDALYEVGGRYRRNV